MRIYCQLTPLSWSWHNTTSTNNWQGTRVEILTSKVLAAMTLYPASALLRCYAIAVGDQHSSCRCMGGAIVAGRCNLLITGPIQWSSFGLHICRSFEPCTRRVDISYQSYPGQRWANYGVEITSRGLTASSVVNRQDRHFVRDGMKWVCVFSGPGDKNSSPLLPRPRGPVFTYHPELARRDHSPLPKWAV